MRKEGSERGGKCPTAHSEKTPELGLELLSASYGALGLPLPALLDIEDRRSPLELGPVLGAKGDRFHSAVTSPVGWAALMYSSLHSACPGVWALCQGLIGGRD